MKTVHFPSLSEYLQHLRYGYSVTEYLNESPQRIIQLQSRNKMKREREPFERHETLWYPLRQIKTFLFDHQDSTLFEVGHCVTGSLSCFCFQSFHGTVTLAALNMSKRKKA